MTKPNRVVRLGGASAFYGDSQLAARQLVEGGRLDYLVFDYLAETTMAILMRAKARSPELGYAVDFVDVALRDVLADCVAGGVKIVANAGGVNVAACVSAMRQLCDELALDVCVAGVAGDDVIDRMDRVSSVDDDGVPTKPASANAYLGAVPIAQALAQGADIVVTGRVVDSALVLGPLMHEFGWGETDYDLLAQGSLAGHIIECGAQCTGGNFTDWQAVPGFDRIGYPIAEVSVDGTFTIERPPESGGLVSVASVAEQLLYEIGDPSNYYTALLADLAV